jgi:hypothetical protein
MTFPAAVALFSRNYEIRPTGRGRPLAGGPEPELHTWGRPQTDAPPLAAAPVAPVALLDLLPPGLFAMREDPVAIPTAEFTAQLAPGATPDEWTFLTQRTLWATGGFCVDEAHAYGEDGRLLGFARQLRRILPFAIEVIDVTVR